MPASAQADVEKRLDDLELRVKALEAISQQTQRTPSTTRSPWRQLAKGMSPNEVHALLGEPDRIEAGPFDDWMWKSGGRVTFMDGEVHRWSEPR
jgi:hypothetical protein